MGFIFQDANDALIYLCLLEKDRWEMESGNFVFQKDVTF